MDETSSKELSEHYDFRYLPLASNLKLRNAFKGSLMYIPMDGHFSVYGNNVTANEICNYPFFALKSFINATTSLIESRPLAL